MNSKQYLLIAISLLLFISCSTYYKPYNPNIASYNYNVHIDSVGIGLLHSEQQMSDFYNDAWTKHCHKKHVYLLPVRIINNSSESYRLDKTAIEVFSGYETVDVLTYDETYTHIKYNTYTNLGWFAGAILGGVSASSSGIDYKLLNPISILVLPGIYFSHRGYKSNQALKTDLGKYILIDKTFTPNSVTDGLLCIEAESSINLQIRFTNR